MNHRCLLLLLSLPLLPAHAASSERYWEKCPGPACPASVAPPDEAKAAPKDDRDKAAAREPAKAGKPAEKVKPGSGVQAPKDGASTVIRR